MSRRRESSSRMRPSTWIDGGDRTLAVGVDAALEALSAPVSIRVERRRGLRRRFKPTPAAVGQARWTLQALPWRCAAFPAQARQGAVAVPVVWVFSPGLIGDLERRQAVVGGKSSWIVERSEGAESGEHAATSGGRAPMGPGTGRRSARRSRPRPRRPATGATWTKIRGWASRTSAAKLGGAVPEM